MQITVAVFVRSILRSRVAQMAAVIVLASKKRVLRVCEIPSCGCYSHRQAKTNLSSNSLPETRRHKNLTPSRRRERSLSEL